MEIEVSVIVPIHGVGKFLNRCLDTLDKQSFELPYEVICVSDNCCDNSDEIIDSFVKKSPNKFVKLEVCNKNPSDTRNDGLKIARGKYILFVDGDDCVLPDYIKELYNTINGTDSDIGSCNYYFIYEGNEYKNKKGFASLFRIPRKCSPKKARKALYLDVQIRGYVWNKIYRKDFIDKYHIVFNKFFLPCDDYNFNSICLAKTDKEIKFTTYRGYLYLQRKNSIIHSMNQVKAADSFLKVYTFLRIYELLNNVDLSTKTLHFSRKLFIKIDFFKKRKLIENYKQVRKEYLNKIDFIKNAKDVNVFDEEIIEFVKKYSTN